RLVNEFLDLTATLSDQSDHIDLGTGVFGDHSEQYALSHPRPGKKSYPLTGTDRVESIDRADAGPHHLIDRLALHRVRRGVLDQLTGVAENRPLPVHRHSVLVDHPPEHRHTCRNGERLTYPFHKAARLHAVDRSIGHEKRLPLLQSHHFGSYFPV